MRLLNSIGIYAVAKISTYAAPIVLLPMLTHMLTTKDYGVIGVFTSLYLAINIFISLSGTGAVTRAFMDKEITGEYETQKEALEFYKNDVKEFRESRYTYVDLMIRSLVEELIFVSEEVKAVQ